MSSFLGCPSKGSNFRFIILAANVTCSNLSQQVYLQWSRIRRSLNMCSCLVQSYPLRRGMGDFFVGMLIIEDLSTPFLSAAKILRLVNSLQIPLFVLCPQCSHAHTHTHTHTYTHTHTHTIQITAWAQEHPPLQSKWWHPYCHLPPCPSSLLSPVSAGLCRAVPQLGHLVCAQGHVPNMSLLQLSTVHLADVLVSGNSQHCFRHC